MEVEESILTDIDPTEIEASPVQRILSFIIDLILEIGSLVILYIILPNDLKIFLDRNNPIYRYVVVFLWFMLYRLITIMLFQRTIGMSICRTKYLNANLQVLSGGEKLIAVIDIRIKKIKVYKA